MKKTSILILFALLAFGQMAWAQTTIDLSTVTTDITVPDGATLTGLLNTSSYKVKISIADGATVTLSGVTINGVDDGEKYQWAGLNCEGDATLILADNSTNTVRGFYHNCSGIYVPVGYTLTIRGNGTLNASCNSTNNNGRAAGIGAGADHWSCGNIIIEGGIINATAGSNNIQDASAAGIGAGPHTSCYNIIIKGGTVTATGGYDAAGIGMGGQNSYINGNIIITRDITRVTATGGNGSGSIGKSNAFYWGMYDVIIGCTLDGEGNPVGGYSGSIAASSVTVYPYTVHYDANGGTGTMDDQLMMHDVPANLTANAFTNGQVTFAGWTTNAAGTGTTYTDAQSVTSLTSTPGATVTLYAKWEYTSDYFSNSGHAGTQADPYLIGSSTDWTALATLVNAGTNSGFTGKYFKLTNDITIAETHSSGTSAVMAGIADNGNNNTRFRGTFDGNGHTLTLDITDNSSDNYCAPFRYLKDGTIKNLRVAGTIVKTNAKNAGGLVGKAEGTNTIMNCRSSVDIFLDHSGDCSSGGFIGELRENGSTTLTNCLFDGKLRGPNNDCWGGFVGWVADGRTVTFNNCLFKPAEVPSNYTDSDNKTFARKHDNGTVTLNNCYYTTYVLGNDAQNATDASSMENSTLLTGINTSNGWEIVTEDAVEKVVPIIHTEYSFNGAGNAASPYLISTEADWNSLCGDVIMGHTHSGKYFKLTADISVTRMVGNHPSRDVYNSFNGTFDGDGHTINVDYTTSAEFCGPFCYTYGATIKNLITTGNITTSAKYAGGVVGRNGTGKLTLTNVTSSVTINSTVSGAAEHGGLVGYAINADIIGCAFTGSLLGASSTGCGGLIGWKSNTSNSNANITNCLFAPTSITVSTTNAFTFVRTPSQGSISVTNCYYTQTLGTEQGKSFHSISAGSNVTVENAGSATEYNVSGITIYSTGFKFNDVLYASNADAVSLNLGYTLPGYDVTNYNASAGSLTGSSNHYTLTMPDANVTISATTTAAEWDGNGDSWETAYLIINKDQFKLLASRVNNGTSTYANKYFKLMTDFTISITGTSSDLSNLVGASTTNTFNGHFDGNNHTITLKLTTSNRENHYMAPFRYTNGAEIKNLQITGTSKSYLKETGGIIGHAQGNNRISGCHVDANFTLYPNQSAANQHPENLECTTQHGTFISYVASGNNVIEGCLFDGSIAVRQYQNVTWNSNDYGAGFVGGSASGATVTVSGCVFNPTSVHERFRYAKTFVAGDATVNVTNSYYIDYPLATAQGKRIRSFAPADEHVTITASDPTVHSVSGITTYDDCIFWDNTFRAGEADEVNLTLSNDLGYYGYQVDAGSIAHNGANWTLTMPDQDVTISAIYDWAGSGTQGDPFIISSTTDLDLLSTRVNNGTSTYNGVYFQLANDLTNGLAYDYSTLGATESNYTAIGNSSHQFDGHFNGQNYTISGIRIYNANAAYQGLFGHTGNNAVLENIRLSDASITAKTIVGGIAGDCSGTISRCHVDNSVTLNTVEDEAGIIGGIAGRLNGGSIIYCTSGVNITKGENSMANVGGIAGVVGNCTINDNFVYGATIPSCLYNMNGSIVAQVTLSVTLNRNYYTHCTVDGVANATNVGCYDGTVAVMYQDVDRKDLAANDGAIPGNARTISGYGESETVGWAFIASPLIATTAPTAVENLFSATEYDLYRLNPSNTMWENYKEHTSNAAAGFNLENSRGYLYATQDGTTVKFIGATTSAYNLNDTEDVTLGEGFNLVGNPFPRAAYINKPYYTLNSDGSAVVTNTPNTGAISPCYGVVVQATASGTLTFSTTPLPVQTANNNGGLNLALTQTVATRAENALKTIDNAIVSFNEGEQLGKFYFGHQDANIYIPQGNEEYAIVCADRDGVHTVSTEVPVNFKAISDGTYTLTVNPEDVEMAYLHLIDNKTGADVDLLATPSYTFEGRINDYASRFKLVFVANNTNLGGESDDNFAFISNGQLIVAGEGTLQIIDMMGRIITNVETSYHGVSTDGMTPGVYVLRLINGENVKTQKIVVR